MSTRREPYLILAIIIPILWESPLTAAVPNQKNCDSCLFQIDSLDQPIDLHGNWLFTRGDNPEFANPQQETSDWKVIGTPGPWKDAYEDHQNFRIGWYRANFLFNPQLIGKEVTFVVDTYMSLTNVYLDGNRIYNRHGKDSYSRYYSIQPIPIRFKITQISHTLVIRVDSILMTGIYQLPLQLRPFKISDTALSLFHFYGGELRNISSFVLFAFGLFFLLIWLRTGYSMYLTAAMVGILVFPFFFVPSDFLQKLFDPEQTLLLHYTGIGGMVVSKAFFAQRFYRRMPQLMLSYTIVFGSLAACFVGLIFQFNLDLFQNIRITYFLLASLAGIQFLYWGLQGTLKKRPGAKIFLAFESVFYLTIINDTLSALGLIQSLNTVFLGCLTSTTGIILIASNHFADTFVNNKNLLQSITELNDNLEKLVEKRTSQLKDKNKDISVMLQNLPQGILTVTEDGTIHQEYSAYLEQIFETREIANRSAMDLIFSQSDVSADQREQISSCIFNFLGEDILNFEVNEGLLVTEAQIHLNGDSKKYLEFTYSPICNEDDIIEKLMIAIRDVTHEKQLEAESKQQKQSLEMISQIIPIKSDNFHGFIGSTLGFIDQSLQMVEQQWQSADIPILFRNLHTIKGNARTLQLTRISDLSHEIEQEFDRARSNDRSQWEQKKWIKQLKQLKTVVEEYVQIHDKVLRRGDKGTVTLSDNETVVQKQILEQLRSAVKTLDPNNKQQTDSFLKDLPHKLNDLSHQRLEDTLSDLLASSVEIALNLEKEVPKINMQDNGIFFAKKLNGVLKDIFTHIIRNSIDHGIEPKITRKQLQKDPQGTINIIVTKEAEQIVIQINDDGRGLNLERIQQKARELGLLASDHTYQPEEIAEFIFHPGVSTAQTISEISGRGVGMDAVRAFIHQSLHGEIGIQFEKRATSTSESVPFTWVIRFPLNLNDEKAA